MSSLNPDREMLAQFAGLMFKRARPDGFVSLRAFPDKSKEKKEKPIFVDPIRVGDRDFLEIATERARQAAAWPTPAVYCPPIATFRDHKNAKTDNICEGVCLSVECDQRPLEARQTLEALLGTATAVVESGGEWTNPATGEIEPKVHLHWRLKKPTATKAEHDLLREARELATRLVGGDDSNISIVHPIRWPGSWHRKGTPRLAETVAFSDDNGVDLAEAVERLRDASGAATFAGFGFKTDNKFRASDPAAVASALSVIPNNDLEWNNWNRIGLAAWAATGGSEIGRVAFHEWSAKSPKNNRETTESRCVATDEDRLRHAGLSGPAAFAGMDLWKRRRRAGRDRNVHRNSRRHQAGREHRLDQTGRSARNNNRLDHAHQPPSQPATGRRLGGRGAVGSLRKASLRPNRHRPERLYRLPRRHRHGQGPATVGAWSNPRRSQPSQAAHNGQRVLGLRARTDDDRSPVLPGNRRRDRGQPVRPHVAQARFHPRAGHALGAAGIVEPRSVQGTVLHHPARRAERRP